MPTTLRRHSKSLLPNWLRDILTGPDNETFDLVRIATAVSLATGLGLEVFVVVVRSDHFDFAAFGTGLGLIIAAGAGGMWARKDVEHKDHDE